MSTLFGGEDRGFSFRVKHDSPGIFEQVGAAGRVYGRQQFTGPLLKDGEGRKYRMRIGSWQVVEQGPICAILKASGSNVPQEDEEESRIDFELKLTAWAGKPWVEVSIGLSIPRLSRCMWHLWYFSCCGPGTGSLRKKSPPW